MSEHVLKNKKVAGLSTPKTMVQLAMLCAISYLVMVVGRIPVVMFLKYDPKDVVITIGGFIFGPLAALLISVVVSAVEMFTVSDTGIIGFVMNVLSTAAFACTAAFLYKKKHTIKGAVTGLVLGGVLMTIIMLLWNYLVTPIYMGYPREAVAAMLPTVFLPFNLLKAALNAAITMLLYKPVVTALRKANLIAPSASAQTTDGQKKVNMGVILISAFVLVTCILLVMVMQGSL